MRHQAFVRRSKRNQYPLRVLAFPANQECPICSLHDTAAAEVTGTNGAILPDVNLAVGVCDLVDVRHKAMIGLAAQAVN